ncbi:class C beta-lactamase [Paraburkholderia ginsengiterrae]|uniref:Beta-lactamase n=1 Tax=Paraburkholderia ginsengiterrae TaxID=1462993 RepID=A0A1A9NFC2_9BURK|nr:class C beta-lactamase [Paraburkholderia ginsengiterrae]OAJ63835.1 class C beta-lactamase [Paraburkholderia ginsengiterrae]OAJ65197.1 class C beta-lactamase [Paraburkholderia ginsengiterrae]
MKFRTLSLMAAVAFAVCATAPVSHAADNAPADIKRSVDAAIQPVMAKYGIHGMAVGIVAAGKPYVFDYGVASAETGQPVTRDTLFELGSISKTFTATLASYAQVSGDLSLSDTTSRYLPVLQGKPFGNVRLVNLGTHTPGGLPLQVPDNIHNNDELMQYFEAWQPSCTPGTCRTYANPGIGMLGLITAKSMGQEFEPLMQKRLFPALGLKSSYLDVPQARMPDYAQGYRNNGAPVRVSPGVLSEEAYGVKATAADMTRFMQANMNLLQLDAKWQHAIDATHTGYFKAGVLTQDLIWEQYAYPVTLKTLLAGNSSAMALKATPATEINPPQAPRQDVWINKTGSTNGFGAYVAYIPEKQLGIVILANQNFPIDDRVSAAYQILTALANGAQ